MSSISLTLSLRGMLLSSSADSVIKGLFSAGEVGVWYDPSDLTTLFQDSAGTTPVTAAGQPVGRMLDKSGRGNHATQATAAQRPIYGFHPYSGVRNLLLATDTMATQSRTVTAVPHTLSFTGTGTITLTGASTAGPLVGTGAGNRVSLTFTPIAGSLTLTVVGSVTFVQLEIGATATAYQTVTTQYNITEAGVPSVSYLAFDGVDDGMVTSAINFSATNKMTVFVGLRKLSDATQGVVAELTQFVGSFAGSFTVFAPATGTAANYGWRCRGNGTVPIVNSPTTFAAPDTAVFTGIGDISGDIATLRIDGVQVATDTTTDQGTGNFANDILYIGRRGGASLPFNGNLYSLIVRGAQSTDSQITSTETWVNGKTGAF